MYKLRSSGLGTTVSPGLGRVPMLVLVPPRLSSSRVFIPITKPTLAPASLRHQPLVTGWSRRNWRPGHSNPCRELLYICHHSHQSIGHTSGPDHTATCWSPQKSETNNRTCGDGWSQNHFIRHKIFKYTDEIVSDTVLLLTFTSKIGLYVTIVTYITNPWTMKSSRDKWMKEDIGLIEAVIIDTVTSLENVYEDRFVRCRHCKRLSKDVVFYDHHCERQPGYHQFHEDVRVMLDPDQAEVAAICSL